MSSDRLSTASLREFKASDRYFDRDSGSRWRGVGGGSAPQTVGQAREWMESGSSQSARQTEK